jgi:hypothetical protein
MGNKTQATKTHFSDDAYPAIFIRPDFISWIFAEVAVKITDKADAKH